MKLTDIVLLITITMLFACSEKQTRFDQFDKKVIEMDIANLGLIL